LTKLKYPLCVLRDFVRKLEKQIRAEAIQVAAMATKLVTMLSLVPETSHSLFDTENEVE
jgi:hypothetical protein